MKNEKKTRRENHKIKNATGIGIRDSVMLSRNGSIDNLLEIIIINNLFIGSKMLNVKSNCIENMNVHRRNIERKHYRP